MSGVAAVLAAVLLLGAGGAPPVVEDLPEGAGVDYQLGGGYAVPEGTGIVVRDRTDQPAGVYDVCYVNAFQTQPGELGWWKQRHPGLLLRRHGRLVRDPGWRAAVLLDTRTAAKRSRLAEVVGDWVARCADDGFEAVEPDNLDSFNRSRGLLRRVDNLALARLYAEVAHDAGLAIAQKNLAGLGPARVAAVGFDFAVAEDCQAYRECGSYRRSHGRRVLEIEYADQGPATFRRACARRGELWPIVLRDRELRRPEQKGYRHERC